MLLTCKIRHSYDFSDELAKAKEVAQFAIDKRVQSTKHVKHIGLKSVIANQILRKYSRNKKAKTARRVKLTIPQQGIKQDGTLVRIPSLAIDFDTWKQLGEIKQVEADDSFFYVTYRVDVPPMTKPEAWIGIDVNATKHIAVAALPTGKVLKLGKQAPHIHQKYKNIRKRLQSKGKYGAVKKIKNRESRIIKDINHKISRKLVGIAQQTGYGLRLEQLTGIRKQTKKYHKRANHKLNSWSFYQLQQFLEYKSQLAGVAVEYVDARYTSQRCSRCGSLGERVNKQFKCLCGHVDHADGNAAFNIGQSVVDRDATEWSTDTHQTATEVQKRISDRRTSLL
jgi:putative transposase